MFSKDYLVRQLQQFVQALAMVLLNKRSGKQELAQSIIHNTLLDVTGQTLERVRSLDRESLLGLVSRGGLTESDLAIAVADLLREDQDPAGRERALWLYEAALESGGTVPLDIHDRIRALNAELG